MNREIEELYKQAEKAYDQKQYQKAIDFYSQIIALNSKDEKAHNNRGSAYHKKGEYDNAIDDYSKVIELNPNNESAYYNRGNVYRKKSEHDQAINDYTQVIKSKPDDENAYNNRGNAYCGKGEYDKALDDYTKAIEFAPDLVEAYNNRGSAYGYKGEYDNAIDDFNKAIKLNPNNATAYSNRGFTYRLLDKEDEALKDFQKATQLDPTVVIQEATKKDREKERETRKKVQETQDFHSILKDLKNEFVLMEKKWSLRSIIAISLTAAILILLLALAICLKLEAANLYAISIFPSVVTMIIIRQYTNAKQLRIEASNRLAMVKMFEWIDAERRIIYKEFISPLTTSIVYSMRKDQNTKTNDLSERVNRVVDNE